MSLIEKFIKFFPLCSFCKYNSTHQYHKRTPLSNSNYQPINYPLSTNKKPA